MISPRKIIETIGDVYNVVKTGFTSIIPRFGSFFVLGIRGLFSTIAIVFGALPMLRMGCQSQISKATNSITKYSTFVTEDLSYSNPLASSTWASYGVYIMDIPFLITVLSFCFTLITTIFVFRLIKKITPFWG